MIRPPSQVGLVIRYDFLWSHERDRGQTAGAKERPCVIVTAVLRGPDGRTDVLVAPITLATRRAGASAIPSPPGSPVTSDRPYRESDGPTAACPRGSMRRCARPCLNGSRRAD